MMPLHEDECAVCKRTAQTDDLWSPEVYLDWLVTTWPISIRKAICRDHESDLAAAYLRSEQRRLGCGISPSREEARSMTCSVCSACSYESTAKIARSHSSLEARLHWLIHHARWSLDYTCEKHKPDLAAAYLCTKGPRR